MKNAIWAYITPSEDEMKELWENSIFAFDANILLNLYRYSSKTRDRMLKIFEDLQQKIWIPHQIAYEFARRRCDVIFETNEKYNKLEEKIINLACDELRLKADEGAIDSLRKEINQWITKLKKRNVIVSLPSEDAILDRLLGIFSGNVGPAFSQGEIEQIEKEGIQRYEKRIPPGYKDSIKKENKYGDLIAWKQMIEYGIKNKKSIIYVSDDKKEDWYLEIKGKTVGPRPELLEEYWAKTNQRFYLYTMDRFVEYYFESRKQSVEEDVMDEVKKAQAQRPRRSRYAGKQLTILSEIENKREYLNHRFRELTSQADELQVRMGEINKIKQGLEKKAALGRLSSEDYGRLATIAREEEYLNSQWYRLKDEIRQVQEGREELTSQENEVKKVLFELYKDT